MLPKRKAAPSSGTGSSAKQPAIKFKRAPSRRPAPKLAAQLDMYIRRSDDEDSDNDPIPPIAASPSKPTRAANAEIEYEPESDEASQIASSDDEEHNEEEPEVKTVSAANLAFLSGLDNNKAIDISQKVLKQKAKDLKRSDRRQFDETRKRIAAQKKAKLTQSMSEDEHSFDDQDFSDEDFEDMEEDAQVMSREKKNYQEYSDVSEGEEVGGSSSDEEGEVAAPVKGEKKNKGEDEDTEAAYLARLGKRKAREQYQEEQEHKKRANAKLPVRKLDGHVSASEGPDSSDDEAEDGEEYRQQSELDGLISSDDKEKPSSSKPKSRAVHAPLPASATADDSDSDTKPSIPTRPTVPHSSITHSSRFNLTAPYEILLTSHTSRLPAPPSTTWPRKTQLHYQRTLLSAQQSTLLLAKNQIASLSSQVIADPEVNLGLLRRLAVFASPTISAPPEKIPEIRAEAASLKAEGKAHLARPTKIEVLPAIRQLAMLSMLAIFVDVLPGYRIRSLTEKEQEEKVGQDVARRREFESGLVSIYRDFLELCEDELKAANPTATPVKSKKPAPGVGKLEKVAVKIFSTLATRAVHFNFRQNILGVVISRLSRRTWGSDEEGCFEAIKSVILSDLTGEVSLEVVRLIHRMTKERRYKVNSRVFDLLLHLRLRSELGNKRSSTTTSTDPEAEAAKAAKEHAERRAAMKAREKKGKGGGKEANAKLVRKGLATHLSKKQVKKQKELKEIQEEMKEAEATVDLEERERNQTETLKLLFVLYFTVLKAEVGSVGLGVLQSVLMGLSSFAHRVNVDFFRDLLNVLKHHVVVNSALLDDSAQPNDDQNGSDYDEKGGNVLLDQTNLTRTIRHIIISLKTTFDLFLGQIEGSILNLDLSDLLSHFYHVLFFLPFVSETHLTPTPTSASTNATSSTVVDLALDSLYAILIKSHTRFSPCILASFAKRLAIISLHLAPTATSGPRKVLALVAHLLAKQSTSASADSQLALLDLQDRSRNGKYDALGSNLDNSRVLESGQSILWELTLLREMGNAEVNVEAERVWSLKDSNQQH